MYNEEEVEDSLAFCRDIQIYYEADRRSPLYDYTKVTKTTKLDMFTGVNENIYTSIESIARDQISEIDTEGKITVLRSLINMVLLVSLAFLLAYSITTFVAHHTKVEGASMEPTLQEDDILIIEKVSYHFTSPKRYDVVVFPVAFDTNVNGTYYIKRIIGLPGETVQIVNGEVYIDGNLLGEDYGIAEILDPGIAEKPLKLGPDEYFVLGDNRNFSTDSRSEAVGVIMKDDIVGKACLRIYPFSSFGGLD